MKNNVLRFKQKNTTEKKGGLLSQVKTDSSLRENSKSKENLSPYLSTNCKRTVSVIAERYERLFEKKVVKEVRTKWYYMLLKWVRKQYKREERQIELSQEILAVMKWCALESTITNKKYPSFKTMNDFLGLWDKLNAEYTEAHQQSKFILKHRSSYLFKSAVEQGMTEETAGLMTEFCEILKSDISKWIDRPKMNKEHLGGDMYRTTTAKDSHTIYLAQVFNNTISYDIMVRDCSRLLVAYPKWSWLACMSRFMEDLLGADTIKYLIKHGVIRFDVFGRHLSAVE